MTIKICSIDQNIGPGRQDIYWNTEDLHLYCEDEQLEYTCETLDAAARLAYNLWRLPEWRFQFTRYIVKEDYYDKWGEDTNEDTMLTPLEIARICRGWDMDPETVMDQLEEAPTLKYFVTLNQEDPDKADLYTIAGHTHINTIHMGDIGIEEEDPQWTNKLDDYLWDEYGILPEEWEVN